MLRRSSSLFQSSDCRLWQSAYTAPGARCRFPWRVSTCRRALDRRQRAHAQGLHGQRHLQRTPRGNCDLLRRPKIIGRIIGREAQWILGFCFRLRCLRFCHHSALQLIHHFERAFDVSLLSALGAADALRLSNARHLGILKSYREQAALPQGHDVTGSPAPRTSLNDLSTAQYSRLSALLDESLDMPHPAREAWLEQLAHDDPVLADVLREMFASRESVEAQGFLELPGPMGGELASLVPADGGSVGKEFG